MKRDLIPSLTMFFFLISSIYGSTMDRPKIGLVLSGGGAKGFAHIGTLKMLDSLQIPVDYIAGTSMGGIAGALYAIGYNGLDLEKLASRNDWQEIFSDKPPRAELPYFQKKETGKYQLEFGLQGLKPTTPSGLIFGQKISLLFSSLTFPYEKITNFDHLPIPFRCVAVDLVTGNHVVLKSGSLAKAMRATMAIPTVFSPVEWGDSLLVDGGFVNNLPVDVVKEMGADIVIAVDVESPLMGRKRLNTVLAVLEQSIIMLGFDRRQENIERADILIRPDIRGFTPADFDPDKIKKIIQRGNIAAHQSLSQLVALKEKYQLRRMEDPVNLESLAKKPRIHSLQITGLTTIPFQFIYEQLQLKPGDICDPILLKRRIADMKTSGFFESIHYEIIPLSDDYVRLMIRVKERQKPVIYGISIVNNQTLPFAFIYRLLGLKPGDQLDTDDLNRRIMEMYGLGYFERILYNIEPKGENQVHLKLTVKELPLRRLRVGLRYDDLYKLVAAASVQATNVFIPGLRFENELQLAGLTRFSSKAYYPSRTLNLPIYPFLRLGYKNIPINIFDGYGVRIARYKDRAANLGIGLGLLFSKSFNTEIEYQLEYMNIKPSIAISDPFMFPTWKDKLRKIHITMNVDMLDDVLLPRKGFLIKARYEGSYKKLDSDLYYYLVNISADLYHTFHHRHTTRIYAFWGTSSSIPLYKFLNQGRPDTFVGMKYDQLYGSQMSILRFDYRYQYKKDIFLKLIVNMAFDLEYHLQPVLYKPHYVWGFGVGVKLLSPVGPIEFIFSRGDKNFIGPREKRNVSYFTLGYKF